MHSDAIHKKAFARVGLLGNPSDGYHGKTLSLSVANFFATVSIVQAESVSFEPHRHHDATSYASLVSLVSRLDTEGYYGGLRLLMATCKVFSEHCKSKDILLHDAGFHMSYETNVPRQSGLSGSSAIVCAALSCLLDFYQVADRVPKHERPGLMLKAEQQELGITAGLQDRVIQVYGGLVYMDFDQTLMQTQGHGRYVEMDTALLPPLWLILANRPSDSGRIHAPVREQWEKGHPGTRNGMEKIALLAEQGKSALSAGDVTCLGDLMDKNIALRRSLFGDAALGETNLQMIELAAEHGGHAKFAGSGGAAVVLMPEQADVEGLQKGCKQAGFELVRIRVAGPDAGT